MEGGFWWWCFGSVEVRSGRGRVRRTKGVAEEGCGGGGFMWWWEMRVFGYKLMLCVFFVVKCVFFR